MEGHKDLYDYFSGGKMEANDQTDMLHGDHLKPGKRIMEVEGNTLTDDGEESVTIHLDNEGLENESEAMVIIAQIDGKDHHIEELPPSRSTLKMKKISHETTSNSYRDNSREASLNNNREFGKRRNDLKFDSSQSRSQGSESILEISIMDPMVDSPMECYICQQCDSIFPDEKSLREHETLHKFRCERCGDFFPNLQQLKSHKNLHQDSEFECNVCQQVCQDGDSLSLHKKTHTAGALFKCPECTRVFFNQSDLQKHKKEHTIHHKPITSLDCDICHKSFKYEEALALHKNIHIDGALFKCSECIRIFFNKEELEEHKKSHTYRPRVIYATVPKVSKGCYKCQYCNKEFEKTPHLENHERIHNGLRPFQCQYCVKAFTQKTHLIRHEMIHRGEKPFRCHFCDRRFGQKSQRKSHERTHTGERPYQCRVCARTFTQVGHLTKHEKIHLVISNQLPPDPLFHCNYCDKTYKHKKNVIAHELMHLGEKPFKCKVCDKAFRRKDVLRSHERSHPELGITVTKRFKCVVCHQQFVNEHSFKVHQLTHGVEVLYMCPICKLEFKSGEEAAEHENVHANEGPFCCPTCNKPYITQAELDDHIKVHVKKEVD